MARLVSKLSRDNLRAAAAEPSTSPEHRRTSSEATPRPSTTFTRPPEDASKRLGFFGDKSIPSAAPSRNGTTPVPASLLPPRSHSRAESTLSRDTTSTTTTVSPGAQTPRAQISPSKVGPTSFMKSVLRNSSRDGNASSLWAP
jgi:hypothetical protein